MRALRIIWLALAAAAALSCGAEVFVGDLNTSFDQANKMYEEGHFAEAAAAYDKMLANGEVSEAVYFNKGNAELKAGRLGRAIAAYLHAQRIGPRDADLRANLQFARSRARGGVMVQPERWRKFFDFLSLNEWTTLLVISFWALFLSLAFGQWRPALNPALRKFSLAAGAAVLFTGVCFAVALNLDYLSVSAVVIAGEAEVRNGPLEEAPSNYRVRDGVELAVLDRKDGWLQVLDSAQRSGWIRRDQVILLEPGAPAKAGQ